MKCLNTWCSISSYTFVGGHYIKTNGAIKLKEKRTKENCWGEGGRKEYQVTKCVLFVGNLPKFEITRHTVFRTHPGAVCARWRNQEQKKSFCMLECAKPSSVTAAQKSFRISLGKEPPSRPTIDHFCETGCMCPAKSSARPHVRMCRNWHGVSIQSTKITSAGQS